jgi:hypothetical protein
MNYNQRITQIDKLTTEISLLNYEKIFLQTKLTFLKDNFFKDFNDEKKIEIEKIDTILNNLLSELTPKITELRNLQQMYLVVYQAEFTAGSGSYWEPQNEYLHLKTDIQIDTITNGWKPYENQSGVNELILEIHFFIINKFSNYDLKQIKRI